MRVAVYGASGFTGSLVTRELAAAGFELVIAGRDRARLERAAAGLVPKPEVRVAPVHDREALEAALTGAELVISCAGPFATIGEPVVRAAIAAGAHYLDTTGEQGFMRRIYECCESAARRAGVCVVSGCAFEIALGDWAATLAARELGGDERLDEVTVAYALDDFQPTAGTMISALDSVAEGCLVWEIDRWEAVPPARDRCDLAFPELGHRTAVSFPSGEVITVPRHIAVDRVQTFLAAGGATPMGRLTARLTGALGPVLPLLARSPLITQARARSAAARAPDPAQRQAARFSIVARASRNFEDRRVAVVGHDPYAVTAAILLRCARSLLSRPAGEVPAGVLAPSEAFDPAVALDDLADRGVKVVR